MYFSLSLRTETMRRAAQVLGRHCVIRYYVVYRGVVLWGKLPDLFPATAPLRSPLLPSLPITTAGFSAYQR